MSDSCMPTQQQNFYFPLARSTYQVTPGLHALGTDFGNGKADSLLFQFDDNFAHYRKTKLAARTESLEKYYCKAAFSPRKMSIINQFLIQQLCHESPDLFSLQQGKNHCHLHCNLTNETLAFDSRFKLIENQTDGAGYNDSFDAIAMQIQEDLSLVERTPDGLDKIIALHLCFPNHWAAQDKIGKSFLASHAPVPGMERIYQRAEQLVTSLIHKGPFVRFAWGLATDKHLNHHPIVPDGKNTKLWEGRRFDPNNPELYLRVERQVIHGFPEIDAFLFTIRTYFYDVAKLKQSPEKRLALQTALQSMSDATLNYKGLTESRSLILEWL